MKFEYYDLQSKKKSNNIELIFPNWKKNNERIVIFSPHDDDVILGAAYILLASQSNGADGYILIFHDGSAGYSKPELKERIVEIRKFETINALKILGIDKEKITRFNLPDFSGIHYLGWKLPWISDNNKNDEGLFSKVVFTLRRIKATRLIFPNGYREHIDHTITCLSAMFDGPQVGDSVIVDRGEPYKIKSFLQYSVWGKFSPESALKNRRNINIRANKAIVVNKKVEEKIINSLMEFKSQQKIISSILEVRKERKLNNNEKYIEVYLDTDPRPRFNYNPYKKLITRINNLKG
ncbi:MAG: PIG-L deacetylase family protein [Promethearchaeota archaeon]